MVPVEGGEIYSSRVAHLKQYNSHFTDHCEQGDFDLKGRARRFVFITSRMMDAFGADSVCQHRGSRAWDATKLCFMDARIFGLLSLETHEKAI